MPLSNICITGAGPAGSIAALFLAKAGVACTLFDKKAFPRGKICGDGISGWVLSVLGDLDHELLLRLIRQPYVLHSHGIRIVAPNYCLIDLPFLGQNLKVPECSPGLICRRIDFDNFLIEEVRKNKLITFTENTEIAGFDNQGKHARLITSSGEMIEAELVIFANGAGSPLLKQSGMATKTKQNTIIGLRAYYQGVTGFHEQNYIELHYLREILPGYLWIFPLPNGLANVGIGLDQHRISKRKINLKSVLLRALETVPYLRRRFQDAALVSGFEAHELPAWDKPARISGDRFMLTGDAARLVDPITGEGIGHAALSGKLAAAQALDCMNADNFSSGFMNRYDKNLYQKIGKELATSRRVQRLIQYPRLFNWVIRRASNSQLLHQELALAMSDLQARKRLSNPAFFAKMLLGM